MSLPAVLIRKSTGEILKFSNYPNIDLSPVQGLEPDLEWILKHTPYPAPEYDSRIFMLKETSSVTTEPHPQFPDINMYKTTYATIKRPNEDIIRAIENAEESANMSVMDYRTNDKLHTLAVGIHTRQNEGILPSQAELEILNRLKEIDVKLWKNDAEKHLKIEQVEAGLEPDIDAGWEKVDVNV